MGNLSIKFHSDLRIRVFFFFSLSFFILRLGETINMRRINQNGLPGK